MPFFLHNRPRSPPEAAAAAAAAVPREPAAAGCCLAGCLAGCPGLLRLLRWQPLQQVRQALVAPRQLLLELLQRWWWWW
jgi:hypothetical protein